MELKEKIEQLKLEQEKAKEVYIKLQGAIEVLASMLEEESNKVSKKGEN
tara:strand:+ start:1117 stop:1263 length:147 start_codon:yes stop_codon:yes gene_type:complete